MREFYRFIHHHHSVGVVLDPKQSQEIISIEKWPIINAYAIDGIGGGFFTQLHRTVNITHSLNERLYQYMDGMARKHALQIHSKKLMNNISLTLEMVADTEQKRKINELNQSKLSELLAETFDLAEMSRSTHIEMSLPFPSVRFGTYTNEDLFYVEKQKMPRVIGKQLIDETPAQTPIPSSLLESGHIPGKPALHFIVENVI